VQPFASVVAFHSKQWFYLDKNNEQKGPILSHLLMHKLKEGELDGLSLVYSTGMNNWGKAGDIMELKEELQKQEAAAEAVNTFNANEMYGNLENQTFESNEDMNEVEAAAKEYFQQGKAKNLIADDGTRHKWDEEEQDWIVDDSPKDIVDQDDDHNGRSDDDGYDYSDEEEHKQDVITSAADSLNANPDKKNKRKRKKKSKISNTWIYVAGLPADVSIEELKEHFSKVRHDNLTGPLLVISCDMLCLARLV
jgi:hypothetical protein